MKTFTFTLLFCALLNFSQAQTNAHINNHLITRSTQVSLLPSAQLMPKGKFRVGTNYFASWNKFNESGFGYVYQHDAFGSLEKSTFDYTYETPLHHYINLSSSYGVFKFLQVDFAIRLPIFNSKNYSSGYEQIRLAVNGQILKQNGWIPNTLIGVGFNSFTRHDRISLNAQLNYQLGKRWFAQLHGQTIVLTSNIFSSHENLLLHGETKYLLSNHIALNAGFGYDLLNTHPFISYFTQIPPGMSAQFGASVQVKKRWLINCSAMYGCMNKTHHFDPNNPEFYTDMKSEAVYAKFGIEWFIGHNK